MPSAGSSITEFSPRPKRFRMIIDFRITVILALLIESAAVDNNPRRGPIARGTNSHYIG